MTMTPVLAGVFRAALAVAGLLLVAFLRLTRAALRAAIGMR
jgi:hypothetical protein